MSKVHRTIFEKALKNVSLNRMQFRFGNTWGDIIGSSNVTLNNTYIMKEKLLDNSEKIVTVRTHAGQILDGITIYLNTGKMLHSYSRIISES